MSEQLESPLFPLRRIEIRNLFGATDVGVDLDPAATVLTGENGSGKSTILKAVSFMSTKDWRSLVDLPLDSVRLIFDNGFEFRASIGDSIVFVTDNDGHGDEIDTAEGAGALQRELEYARYRMNTSPSAAERARQRHVYDRLRVQLHSLATEDRASEPEWIEVACTRIRTKLISARRLEHGLSAEQPTFGEEGEHSVVDVFASNLADRMKTSLSAYATESRQQEKVLPSQIVSAMLEGGEKPDEELAKDVDKLRAEVRQLADSLTRVGLFQEEDPDPQFVEYPRDNTSIMLAIREVYRVTLQRLQQLTSLRADLELFTTFMNQRLTGKRIALRQGTGIEVELRSGEVIRPSQLSSGEQQLLAVAYELLFATPRNSLVLLDEPELSLHVAWTQGLLSALLDIGESRDLQYLLATHSSGLLAGYQDDLERSLDEDLSW